MGKANRRKEKLWKWIIERKKERKKERMLRKAFQKRGRELPKRNKGNTF